MFGMGAERVRDKVPGGGDPTAGMANPDPVAFRELFERAPADRPRERIDVRELGPPEPLVESLETLADAPDGTVLLQFNDRVPRHLYPKLEDRGYAHETVEDDGAVLTAIWVPEP